MRSVQGLEAAEVDADTIPMAVSLLLIGAAGLVTSLAAVKLPAGRRLESLIALVAGAGAGLSSIAVGVLMDVADEGSWFLISTVVGLAATMAVLAVLIRKSDPTGAA